MIRFRAFVSCSIALAAAAIAAATVGGCGSKDQMQPPRDQLRQVTAPEDDPSLPPGYARGAIKTVIDAGSSGDAGLAVPGPTALACTTDDDCITHKCNAAYGRCAFPCASDADCIAGTYCYKSVVSACMPKEGTP